MNQITGIRLPRLGQIGMVVYSADRSMEYFKSLGIGPWMLWEGSPEFTIEKHGPVNASLKIAMAYSGGIQIELIEVTSGRSYYNDTLDRREGLHHLGFMVNNLDERVEECRAIGIDVLQSGRIKSKGFTVDYAYMDTQAKCGVIIEFIQTRLGPLPLKMNRFTHALACKLGI
jgi:methylmalonyl-CoA/ethylmalonyl-CoA epimerase